MVPVGMSYFFCFRCNSMGTADSHEEQIHLVILEFFGFDGGDNTGPFRETCDDLVMFGQ